MRAIDLFRVSYGAKFCTYATTAIRRRCLQYLQSEQRRRQRFTSGENEANHGDAHLAMEDDPRAIKRAQAFYATNALLQSLNARDRAMVERRFGMVAGGKGHSYRELGEYFGVSKERVRQVVQRAMHRLRRLAETRKIDLA